MRRLLWFAIIPLLTISLWMAPGASNGLPTDEAKPAANSALKLRVGDTAPDFTLRDQTGQPVSLHDYRGKKRVVLAFYVFAFTGG